MTFYNVKIAFDEETEKGPKVRREEFVVAAHSCIEAIANATSEFGSNIETYEVTSVSKTKIKGAYQEPEKSV